VNDEPLFVNPGSTEDYWGRKDAAHAVATVQDYLCLSVLVDFWSSEIMILRVVSPALHT
jgi:hypothetical protein